MAEPMLSISGLTAGYGDVRVLWDIDLEVHKGTIACLVGSNGAGKTTLLRTISGVVRAGGGQVRFDGQNITGAASDVVLRAGIAHVPEGRRLFRGLTVRDNLLLGAQLRKDRAGIQADLERIYEIFPILKERRGQDATTLSGGEQQMCAVARGIMSRPRLLMIDELSLGLAPAMVESLSEALTAINRGGTTIFLVEQDVMTAFELSDMAFVIETGRIAKSGVTAELADDPAIREAYLGL